MGAGHIHSTPERDHMGSEDAKGPSTQEEREARFGGKIEGRILGVEAAGPTGRKANPPQLVRLLRAGRLLRGICGRQSEEDPGRHRARLQSTAKNPMDVSGAGVLGARD